MNLLLCIDLRVSPCSHSGEFSDFLPALIRHEFLPALIRQCSAFFLPAEIRHTLEHF